MMNHVTRRFLVIAFYMGFAASVSQALLLREILVLCRGNELLIGIIFFSWFLGIYAGARINPPENRRLNRRVILSMFLLPALLAVSVYSMSLIPAVFPRKAGAFYPFSVELILCLVFTLPVGFVVGFFFPALVSLLSGLSGPASGGMAYYAESFGSFAGGIAFSFVLVKLANPLACALLLVSAALVIAFGRRRVICMLSAVPLILISFSGKAERKIFAYAWNKAHAGMLIDYRRTKYGMVNIESSAEAVAVYGDGMFMYSLPDTYEARDVFHFVRAVGGDNGRILLFGTGPGSLLHNLLMAGNAVSYFDTDPEIWNILQPYTGKYYGSSGYGSLALPGDLKEHLKKNADIKYDTIICLPPPPYSIMLNRFYTREFYSLCRSRLSENGIFVSALYGFGEYMSDDTRKYTASVYSAFIREFPEHMETSGETIYLIGAKNAGVLPSNVNDLVSRYGSRIFNDTNLEKGITDNYSPEELRMFFEDTRIEYFKNIIPALAGKTSANSDMKPTAYWRYISFTAFRENSALYALLRSYVLFPLILIALSTAAFLDVRRKHGPRFMMDGILMYIAGFAGISAMMTLILVYQNAYGMIYYRVSLINAVFMYGLTMGAFVFSRTSVKLFYVFLSLAASILPILLLTVLDIRILYWISIIVFSFFCGAIFPVLFKPAADHYKAASVLDSMDHFGAIAGSFLTVATILPLAGIQGAIILNIVLVLLACGVSFLLYRD